MDGMIHGYFAIADALGFPLDQNESGLITGEANFRIPFGNIKLPLKPKVLSNLAPKDSKGLCLLLLRVKGNLLALFEAHSSSNIKVHFLNATHLQDASGWLERTKPKTAEEALGLLKAAHVRSYAGPARHGHFWEPII